MKKIIIAVVLATLMVSSAVLAMRGHVDRLDGPKPGCKTGNINTWWVPGIMMLWDTPIFGMVNGMPTQEGYHPKCEEVTNPMD